MRRLAVALSLVIACALLVPAAAASTGPGRLVITGDHSASAIVTLPQLSSNFVTLDVTMRGTYAGYLIFPLHGDRRWPLEAQIAVPGLDLGKTFAIPIAASRLLHAGRYELVLFTDGPATITVPTMQAGTVRVHPTHAVRSWGRLLHLAPLVNGVPVPGDKAAAVPAGTWMEAGMIQASSAGDGATAENSLCFTTDTSCGSKGEVDGGTAYGEIPSVDSGHVGYSYWAGSDTVELYLPPQCWLRYSAVDINANDRAFAWGMSF